MQNSKPSRRRSRAANSQLRARNFHIGLGRDPKFSRENLKCSCENLVKFSGCDLILSAKICPWFFDQTQQIKSYFLLICNKNDLNTMMIKVRGLPERRKYPWARWNWGPTVKKKSSLFSFLSFSAGWVATHHPPRPTQRDPPGTKELERRNRNEGTGTKELERRNQNEGTRNKER